MFGLVGLFIILIQGLDLGAPINRPGVLFRPHTIIGIDSERLGRVQRPERIMHNLPTECHQVGTTTLQNFLGLVRIDNDTHCHRFDAGLRTQST